MALYEQLEQNGKVMVGRILSNFKKFLSTTTDPQDVKFGTVEATGNLSLGESITGGFKTQFNNELTLTEVANGATENVYQFGIRSVNIIQVWRGDASDFRSIHIITTGFTNGAVIDLGSEGTTQWTISMDGRMLQITNNTGASRDFKFTVLGSRGTQS